MVIPDWKIFLTFYNPQNIIKIKLIQKNMPEFILEAEIHNKNI